jgi:hypothetical protein
MSPSRSRPLVFAAVAALAAVAACSSHQDDVCQDVGDCSRGGDNVWIEACQVDANELRTEAGGAGCGPAFDDYYACADGNYTCVGATAEFPGCDDRLAALDACLAAATAGTSCAALASAEAACAGSTPDGGAGADAGVPPACTAARDCLAGCYLGAVANVCAPGVGELEASNACAASCPP